MENSTVLPIGKDCIMYDHEPLWIISMVVVSAILTTVAALSEGLRKRRARASARTIGGARPPPPLPWEREGEGGGGGDGINRTISGRTTTTTTCYLLDIRLRL